MAKQKIDVSAVKNRLYRFRYTMVLTLLQWSVLGLLILLGVTAYLYINKPIPNYYVIRKDNTLKALVPLSEPNLSKFALLQWASTAATAAYTYNFDFQTYPPSFSEVKKFFTDEGWSRFLTALYNAGTLETVKNKKLFSSAVTIGVPVILFEGPLHGLYAWRIQVPMLVTYQSSNARQQQKLMVNLVVSRVRSLVEHPNGIGIVAFSAT